MGKLAAPEEKLHLQRYCQEGDPGQVALPKHGQLLRVFGHP